MTKSKRYMMVDFFVENKHYERKVFAINVEHTCAICGKKKVLARFPSAGYKDKAFEYLCSKCGRKVDKAISEWEAVRAEYARLDNLIRVTARRAKTEARLEAHLAKLRGRLEKLRAHKLAIKELKKMAGVQRQGDFFG